ncbi:hypothetical protein EJD97_018393, partial [Solanum chilense]
NLGHGMYHRLGQQTRTNDIGHGMPSSPLGITQNRTTSIMSCHHLPWTAHTIRLLRALHAIITLGLHMRLDDIRHCMPAWPLGNTHGLMTSGMACNHLHWASARSDDVRHYIPSSPFCSTLGRMTSGVTYHLFPWKAHMVRQRRAWNAIIFIVQHTW